MGSPRAAPRAGSSPARRTRWGRSPSRWSGACAVICSMRRPSRNVTLDVASDDRGRSTSASATSAGSCSCAARSCLPRGGRSSSVVSATYRNARSFATKSPRGEARRERRGGVARVDDERRLRGVRAGGAVRASPRSSRTNASTNGMRVIAHWFDHAQLRHAGPHDRAERGQEEEQDHAGEDAGEEQEPEDARQAEAASAGRPFDRR